MHALDAMQLFVRIAERGSFTRAADELGQPRSVASAAVRTLEAQLGTQLLHRTTRRVRMTDDGRQFYERCRDLLADYDEVRSLFQRSGEALRGRLRVDMSSGLARHLVIPALPGFLRAHPQIALELSATDRRVDVVGEGFDCVVRVGPLAESSLVARPLGAFEILNCAAPGYLQARGVPRSLDDLAGHTLVHYVSQFGAAPEGWEYRDADGAWRTLPMPGALTVNNAEAYQAACLAGLGLIQAPAPGVRAHLAAGTLVEVLPDLRAEPMPVWVLYPHRRHLSRRVRAFMDWLEATLRPHLLPADAGPQPPQVLAR
ncbi:MAG: LysR family transcriptional regulator [Lysobacteraceae bacterium]